ncbi:GrpB family protein [Pantoea sp. FN0302]|uniref:GrpB family protein n=1 Tax=Pantoea sp. FN0302 TaxID=3418558 RepID=UPI003CE6BBCC
MRTIIVVPYDDKWPEMFEAESLLIKTLLGGVAKSIHHIGSTSVPGLSAKPVIDILLEVSDINELDRYNSAMTRAGYVARGENGISGRRYFIKGGDQRSHQVHAFAVGDMQVVRHLAFRDYLRKNRAIAGKYAEIKLSAALLSKNDVHRYSALKANFIEHHLRLALNAQERSR